MDKLRFIEILKNPASLMPSDFEALEEVLDHYPYMQSAHLLKAKYLYDKGSMHAEKSLRSAAVFANDRVLLKQLIYGVPAPAAEIVEDEPVVVVEADTPVEPDTPPETPLAETTPVEEISIPHTIEDSVVADAVMPSDDTETAQIADIKIESQDSTKPIENVVPVERTEAVLSILSKELIKEWKKEIAGIEDKSAVKKTSRADAEALRTIASLVPVEIPALREEISDFISLDIEEDFTRTLSDQETRDLTSVWMSESELGDELVNDVKTSDIGTPLEADVLIEYLNYLENRSKEKPRSNLDFDYIERFIKEEPRISRIEPRLFDYSKNKNWANDSEVEDAELVSENLAIIMVRQNKLKRAIDIYNKLILKYPEKKDYFVQKIEDLEKN